jgi:hypothetical protein
MSHPKQKNQYYGFSGLLVLVCLSLFSPGIANAQKDSLAFGDKNWVSDGLMGKLYFLPDTTRQLPDFDTMKSRGTLYARKIDVPERSWETGFPGIPNRFEWFAIVYTGSFKVKKAGHYTFRLLSDDGSKLYIDKKLVIDNDGVHSASSRLGDLELNASRHSITLQYFQGPRTELALQLFATLDKENEQIFPGTNFILITPPKHHYSWLCYLLYISIALLILLLFLWWRRRKKTLSGAKH